MQQPDKVRVFQLGQIVATPGALAMLLKEGQEMCRILSAIERHPASHEERRAIMEQRVKENTAQHAYDSARQVLFTRAGWGV